MAYAMYIQDVDGVEAIEPPARAAGRRKASAAPVVGRRVGRMSLVATLLSACVGFLSWCLTPAFSWIPGLSWIVSGACGIIQGIIAYIELSSQRLSLRDRAKILLFRYLILSVASALQGIPIIGMVIPFEAISAFVLRHLDIPVSAA